MLTQSASPGLRRELGKWDLTAIGVNQVIGASIFAVPATVAATTGAWSPWIVAALGLASTMIAACFAEVGSRFDATGGPYLYTRTAFGRFAGFEVGWMLWFTRAASWAAVVNVLATSLAFYWTSLNRGWPRNLLIALVIALVTAVNVRGIRLSSIVLNTLTVGKVLPLIVFIVVGIFYVDPGRLVAHDTLTLAGVSTAGLTLIFAFGGYEVVPVPAGEARDPRRALPFAMITTLVSVTVIMVLVQVVALGTLPDLASSKTPLTHSASVFLGAAGAVMITLGAVVSTTGNNMGQALSGPRNLFALSEQGDLSPFFGRIHPRFRTPANAILFTAAVVLVLALSGTFEKLALASAVSRLVVYVFTCGATLRLRQPRFAGMVNPPTFIVPLGPVVPALALVVSLVILAGARRDQQIAGALALIAGAVLYFVATASGGRRRVTRS